MDMHGLKHAQKMKNILLDATERIAFQLDLCTENVSFSVNDSLVMLERFKFQDEDPSWSTLNCIISSEDALIDFSVLLPIDIPVSMERDAIELANWLNKDGYPCAVFFSNQGKFSVRSSISFAGYYDSEDDTPGADQPGAQVEATMNLLAAVFSVAKKLDVRINQQFKDISDSLFDKWESLVPPYQKGTCNIKPLDEAESILLLRGISKDFDHAIERYIRNRWREFCRHNYRAYLIESPDARSVACITWIGHRGCRWHLATHYQLENESVPSNHQEILEDLIAKYQDAWDAAGLPGN